MPRARRSDTPELSKGDFFAQLSEKLIVQARTPNILGYVPHDKQRMFHTSQAKGRLYIGGNRSGKSYGSVAEDVMYARGKHPFRTIPGNGEPTRGRIVAVDFIQGVEKIIMPLVSRLIPPSDLINGSWEDSYNKALRTLTLENKATIEFMSYESDLVKFAGTSRHWVHFDEEPPKHIFNECLARLVDTDGDWWISMTPVDGMTWIYDDIYIKAEENPGGRIAVVEADMLDNPHIKPEAAEAYLSTLDAEERDAREHGKFVQLGGRVFKNFEPAIHVVDPFVPPKDWQWYNSLDHGYNNPTAVLWHAVSPKGQVVTFAEHYAREMLVSEHATIIHARDAAFGRVPDIRVADPATSQRQAVTGTSIQLEYVQNGLTFVPGNNDVQVGIARMASYLRPDSNGVPRWTITANCTNLIREMKKLRWKTFQSRKAALDNNAYDQIHKKDDHAPDSARYFFTLMPDLYPSNSIFGEEQTTGAPWGTTVNPASGQNFDAALQQRAQANHAAGTRVATNDPRDKVDWRMDTEHNGYEWD